MLFSAFWISSNSDAYTPVQTLSGQDTSELISVTLVSAEHVTDFSVIKVSISVPLLPKNLLSSIDTAYLPETPISPAGTSVLAPICLDNSLMKASQNLRLW